MCSHVSNKKKEKQKKIKRENCLLWLSRENLCLIPKSSKVFTFQIISSDEGTAAVALLLQTWDTQVLPWEEKPSLSLVS